jgi:hypothetical protein
MAGASHGIGVVRPPPLPHLGVNAGQGIWLSQAISEGSHIEEVSAMPCCERVILQSP